MKPFTAREQEVARLIAQGYPYKMIAVSLGISKRTVEVHARNLFAKLGVRNAVQAAVMLVRERMMG